MNECLESDACGVNAVCQNVPGNYTCSCLQGFQGNPYDGVSLKIDFFGPPVGLIFFGGSVWTSMSVRGRRVHPGLNARTWRAGSDAFVPAVLTAMLTVLAAQKLTNVRERRVAVMLYVVMKQDRFRVLVHPGLEGTRWSSALVSGF